MPEVEDLTMHLAEAAHIDVVPHTLMRMADNTLCYLTRRIDRTQNGGKIAMEDMCQLTERQTEHIYQNNLLLIYNPSYLISDIEGLMPIIKLSGIFLKLSHFPSKSICAKYTPAALVCVGTTTICRTSLAAGT